MTRTDSENSVDCETMSRENVPVSQENVPDSQFHEAEDRTVHMEHTAPEVTRANEEVADVRTFGSAISSEDSEKSRIRHCSREDSQERRVSDSERTFESMSAQRTGVDTEEDGDREGPGGREPLLPTGAAEDVEIEMAHEEDKEEDGVPYDSGWAWMVCLGSFICFVCLSGFLKSSGMIFVELLRQFNAPASQTALLFALRAGIFSISGLYVMNVIAVRLGARKTALIGAMMMSLSAITSSFASDLSSLICLQSLLLGVGMAMLISPGEVLMGSYFQKRRSLALAIAKCGASVGSIGVPPLISYLIDEYGLRGTLLLYGGICLHTIPAALLLRPTSYFSKRYRKKKNATEQGVEGPPTDDADFGRTQDEEGSRRLVHNVDSGHVSADSNQGLSASQSLRDKVLVNGFVQDLRRKHAGGDALSEQGERQPLSIESLHSSSVPKSEAEASFSFGFKNETNVSDGECSPTDNPAVNKLIEELRSDHFGRAPGYRPRLATSLSHDYDASVRKRDKIQDDRTATSLTASFPALHLESVDVHVPCTRLRRPRRSISQPDVDPDSIRHSALDLLTENRLVQYMSASTLALGSMPVLCRYASVPHHKDIVSAEIEEIGEGSDKDSGEERKSRCLKILKTVLTCPKKAVSMLDFSLFKNPVFRVLIFYFMLSPVINCNLDYLPALAVEHGVTEYQASLLLSIIGGLDLVCRLAAGFVADSGKISVATLIIITYCTMGIINQFVRFLTTFPMFCALAVLQGLLGGVGNCLAVVLIIEFVGVDHLSKAIGFVQLTSGGALAAIYPLLGFIRDATGSYAVVYHAIGIMTFTAAGILALVCALKRRWEKPKKVEQSEEIDIVMSSREQGRQNS